ncbi:MAG TPA: hypothetical protein VGF79_13970 [Bacteroidia bacterium]
MKKRILMMATFAVLAGSGVLYAFNSKTEKSCAGSCSKADVCCSQGACEDACTCGDECTGSGCDCGCSCCE